MKKLFTIFLLSFLILSFTGFAHAISSFGLSNNFFKHLDLKRRYDPLKTFVTIDQGKYCINPALSKEMTLIHSN